MVSNTLVKILGTCSAILGAVALYFYVSLSNVRTDNIELENRVEELSRDNDRLSRSLDDLRALRDAENQIVKDKKERSDELAKDQGNTLQQIDRIITTQKENRGIINDPKKLNESPVDDSIGPELSILLDELCERVRGNSCPPP